MAKVFNLVPSPDGDDLAKKLRRERLPLGKPYALYVIALATQIDEKELAWLQKYSAAIDSLTGRAIAFVLFFNSLKPSSPIAGESTADRDPEASSTQGAHFARSMTYESDKFARALGIHPSDLPCLVLIDNPEGRDFYTHPLIGNENYLLDLRKIFGDFCALPECQDYVRRLEAWDGLHRDFSMLLKESLGSDQPVRASPPLDSQSPEEQEQGKEDELDMRWAVSLQLMRRAEDSLRSAARPKILPILNRMKWGRRRRSATGLAAATAVFLKDNAETVLKAIGMAIKRQQ